MPPARSGIQFENRLDPLAACRNRNLMNGAGVALGDFDGDGRCDLFFCSLSGTNALYRNLGDWKFEEVTRAAGVGGEGWASTGAVFADLDGDQDLDLFVATLGAGTQCYRNLGQGRFERVTQEAGLVSTAGSTSLVLGDIDGDGDLDLYVVNYGAESVLRSGGRAEVRRVNGRTEIVGPNAHRLRFVDGQIEEVGEAGVMYRNDGRGHFEPLPWNSDYFLGVDGRPKPPPLDYGLGAQLRDVNGDGAPDLYVCNDFQMPDRLWLNDGHGRFREAPGYVVRKFPFSSMGVDFGDLDRDGVLDFLVVEMAVPEPSRALRTLAGMRPQPNLPGRFEDRPQVLRNALYRGHPNHTWSEIAEYAGLAATDWSWQPVFLDADLDGFEDVLIVNGMMFDTQDRDTLARIEAIGRQSPEASRTNLLLYPPLLTPNLAYRNRGHFQFEDASKGWGFDSTRISQGIALGDLDNDGDADVVVNCLNAGPLLLRNEGSAPRLAVRLRGRAPNTRGIGARVEVEGGPVTQAQEMLAGGRYLSSDDSFRTFAAGSATQLTVRITWRSGKVTRVTQVPPNVLLEVNENEARLEPATPAVPPPTPWFANVSAALAGHRHAEPVFDDFARQPLLPRQLSSLGPGVAWCDLDGDGAEELVVGTGRGGTLGVFRFDDRGVTHRLECAWPAPDDVLGLTGWLTADGRPSLLAAVAGYESASEAPSQVVEISLRPDTEKVEVMPRPEFSTPASLGPLAAADLDGDGDLDLFAGGRVVPGAYPYAPASHLWRGERGGWVADSVAAPLFRELGMISGAVWSDLEGDGFPELILAGEWGPVRVYRNTRGALSEWDPPLLGARREPLGMTLSNRTGWWTSVAVGDFNEDGRMDIVVGNWGLNSGYRTAPGRPLRLSAGEFNPGTAVDLLEWVYAPELQQEVPRRSLPALAQAFPVLAARFPTHAGYAVAGAAEVLSAIPQKFTSRRATTLATTLFLNFPEGWQEIALPAEAQTSTTFGMVVADADGDGHQDLFLAQNFFATRVEWPRSDAGLGCWLAGDGHGGFRALESTESGLALYGEQRGAAMGWGGRTGVPLLAVAQNGAATTLWQGRTPAPKVRIRCRGPAGNPCGYGVTVQPLGSTTAGPVLEVRASQGYLSKDSAVLAWTQELPRDGFLVRWPGGREERVPVPELAKTGGWLDLRW